MSEASKDEQCRYHCMMTGEIKDLKSIQQACSQRVIRPTLFWCMVTLVGSLLGLMYNTSIKTDERLTAAQTTLMEKVTASQKEVAEKLSLSQAAIIREVGEVKTQVAVNSSIIKGMSDNLVKLEKDKK